MTKTHVAPYINFQGKARDAMEHYHKVLGGTLELFSSDEQGRPKAAGAGETIMYARLESDAIIIIASRALP